MVKPARSVSIAVVVLLAACAGSLGASGLPQESTRSAPDEPSIVAARADSLLMSGAASAALDLLDVALADKGPHPELSSLAARAAVNLGMVTEPEDRDRARRFYEVAEAYAERRISVDSTDAHAWEWLAVSRGRRTLTEGRRTRATLANDIRTAASRALALDSLRPGAHHVLGMWHAEIRRLNTFERLGAGALGGDDFGSASWDRAIHHLETATRLAPDAPVHGVELARLYLDVDRLDDALTVLRRVVKLDAREPGDVLLRTEAEALLARLEGGFPPASPAVSDREASSPPN
jgi:tetratricopeptide (TPR) repeat protein